MALGDAARVLDRLREQVSVRPDWSVQDGAYLGLFSFAKQAMYADLDALRARLTAHPVVRALAGEHDTLPPFRLPDPGRLDEQEHPHETFQVLDADASQRTVLAAIRSGSNLVVQGPPGTGKSQSIANAIAEALAQGKSVLFVSEKLAALKEHGAVYLNAIGGAAQFYARTITGVDGVSLLEFGTPEAMWHLRVDQFPAIVTMDAHGHSLHADIEQESGQHLEAMRT